MRFKPPLRLPLRFAVAAALLAVALAGSTAVSLSSAAGEQQAPLLRIGIPHPINTWDLARDGSSLPYVAAAGLEPLLIVKNGKITPWLAQSITQPGRGVYVYHLRHGIKFWDGNELTAADVANSLNYYRAPTSYQSFYFPSVKSIVALNRYTVAATLKRPDVSFQFNIATSLVPIFEKKFQDEHGASMGQPGTGIMGTGPYKFDSLDPTKGAELSANPNYWGAQKPIFKHLSFKFFNDVTSMALAFRAGAIDLVPEINDARAWRATTGVNPTIVPGCEIHMFGMPTTAPPWNDLHVRRAVAYALNRTDLIQSRGTPSTPVTTLVLPSQLYRLRPKAVVDKMIRSLPQYPFDLAKAKAELAKSKYPNGFSAAFPTVTAFFGNEPQVVANELAKIGIKLAVENIPFSDWIDHIVAKHDIPALTYATCLTGDAHDYVTNYLESGAISNYRPPALKALDRQSVFYSNAAKRFAVYTKLLRLLATDVPFVPEYSGYAVMAISPKFAWPTFDGSGWLTRDYIQEIRPK